MEPELGTGFKTTHLSERVMARVEAKTRRVDRWRTSDQQQRWGAAVFLPLGAHLRRVKRYRLLPLLLRALAPKITSPSTAAV
ncbi:MAG: hypothetical protein ABIZ91_17220 [Gemmatimonadaceae bacterium]